MGIENEYFDKYSRIHYAGMENYYYGKGNELEFLDNTKISDSAGGTICRNAYISMDHKKQLQTI